MKSLIKLCGASLILLVTNLFPAQAETSPLAASDVIAITQQLEQRPLATEANNLRQQLFEWTSTSDDVLISVCDILGPIPSESDIPYAKELLVQSFFGNAAYQLQHPEHKDNQLKLQMAGIRSMLLAYRNIVKQDKAAHIPTYDNWLKALDNGKLAQQLLPTIARKCVRQDDPNPTQFALNF